MGAGNVLHFCGLYVVWLLADMVTVGCDGLCLCDGARLSDWCLVYCLCWCFIVAVVLVIIGVVFGLLDCGLWLLAAGVVFVVYFCLIINSVVIASVI